MWKLKPIGATKVEDGLYNLRDNHPDTWLGTCAISAHAECDASDCEVVRAHNICQSITEGQIKIAIWTALAGLVVSTTFAVAIIGMWVWHGEKMPDIPAIVASIAMAPFVAAGMLSIPRKTPWKIGK